MIFNQCAGIVIICFKDQKQTSGNSKTKRAGHLTAGFADHDATASQDRNTFITQTDQNEDKSLGAGNFLVEATSPALSREDSASGESCTDRSGLGSCGSDTCRNRY